MQNTLNHLLLLISFWISGKRKEVKREKSNSNFTLQFTLIIGHTPLPVDTFYSFIQDYIWTDTFSECLLLLLLHLKIIDNQEAFRSMKSTYLITLKSYKQGKKLKTLARESYVWFICSMNVLITLFQKTGWTHKSPLKIKAISSSCIDSWEWLRSKSSLTLPLCAAEFTGNSLVFLHLLPFRGTRGLWRNCPFLYSKSQNFSQSVFIVEI